MARDTVPNRQATLEERTFFEALLGLRAAYGRRGSADAEGVISINTVLTSASDALARTASSPPAPPST
jgi:hypothetical protein